MTREFLEKLGIEGEAAEAILEELQMEAEGSETEAAELRRQLAEKENELYEVRRDYAVSDELRRFGARNSKAVKALLDMDGVTFDGESLSGLIEQLEKLKAENGYLFGVNDAPKVVASSGGGRGKGFGFRFTGVR